MLPAHCWMSNAIVKVVVDELAAVAVQTRHAVVWAVLSKVLVIL